MPLISVLFAMLLGPALAAAVVPAPPAPVNTAAPSLTGTPGLGSTLSCSQGSWKNNPTTYSYAWLRNGVPIAGQAGNTYAVQVADLGHAISCQVTAGKQVGEYTVQGLPSGSYKVYFYAPPEGNLLPQFFSGQTAFAAANNVSATAGSVVSGISAALQAGGQISGTVTDAITHMPINGIEVCAHGEAYSCATTNAAGQYTISKLVSGTYKVEFYGPHTPTNYLSQYYNGSESEGSATSVTVAAPGMVGGIDAEMHTGGEIKGKVTDASTHAGIQYLEVCARGSKGNYGCATTNPAGEYSISGLPNDSYKVGFFSEYGIFSAVESGNYLAQYFNGKATETEAEPVEVKNAGTVNGVDAEMHPGGQIQGTVTAASTHAGIAGALVCAFTTSGIYSYSCAVANANGEYTVKSLSTAPYEVEFFAGYEAVFGSNRTYLSQFYNDQSSQAKAEPVLVKAGETQSGINAELQSGGQIKGRVVDASTHAPLANFEVCASLLVGESGFDSGCSSTNSAGEYTITGLSSGTYLVEYSSYGCESGRCENLQDYSTQYYSGKPLSNEGAPVTVTAPNTTNEINAEMHAGAEISGRVTNAANGAPLGGVEVCAENTIKEAPGGCAVTNTASNAALAASNALTIPGSKFTLSKVKFDAKTDDIDFFFTFPTAGTLKWSLFFKNADVGFADSLGLSLGDEAMGEAARSKDKGKAKGKAKRCKKGEVKHHGKCKRTTIAFASGSTTVAAGAVEVKVHADAKAIKALKAGHTLHVSGTFVFQSVFGGPASILTESTTVKLPKAKKHRKGHGKGKKR